MASVTEKAALIAPDATPAMIGAARSWVADCLWSDVDAAWVADASDAQMIMGVEVHYDGGWAQFVADNEDVQVTAPDNAPLLMPVTRAITVTLGVTLARRQPCTLRGACPHTALYAAPVTSNGPDTLICKRHAHAYALNG